MNYELKRYELFGWDYDYMNPMSEKEINWYIDFIQETVGPVLELACGRGRLLSTIAQAGYEITGIDLSGGMLSLAREHVSKLPVNIQKRIHLLKMDMSNFHLESKFGLVYIADNSFRELEKREQLISCLKCIHKHLKPEGKLLITERRFDPSRYMNGRREFPWSEAIPHPVTGDMVTRRIEVQVSDDEKWINGVMYYKTIHKDGRESIEECSFKTPVMRKEDYISIFLEAGFSTESFSDYERKESNGTEAMLCFVCKKLGDR